MYTDNGPNFLLIKLDYLLAISSYEAVSTKCIFNALLDKLTINVFN